MRLDEPDGVSGILVSQDQCPTLQQLILAHEVNGQLQVNFFLINDPFFFFF